MHLTLQCLHNWFKCYWVVNDFLQYLAFWNKLQIHPYRNEYWWLTIISCTTMAVLLSSISYEMLLCSVQNDLAVGLNSEIVSPIHSLPLQLCIPREDLLSFYAYWIIQLNVTTISLCCQFFFLINCVKKHYNIYDNLHWWDHDAHIYAHFGVNYIFPEWILSELWTILCWGYWKWFIWYKIGYMNIGFSILTNEPVDIVYLTCTLDECIVDLFIECMAWGEE